MSETLFSFELLVEHVRLERRWEVFSQLALGVRLLDFPTLLIYQPHLRTVGTVQSEQRGQEKPGEFIFNRGKSCFFKVNLSLLQIQLSSTPLHAMVLDVTGESPRLVGSSLISLAKVMDRIKQDVTECGISSPSSHRERGLVAICNLAGEKIGTISLRYKLVSLGASLLPHITERREDGRTSAPGGQRGQDREKNKSSESFPPGSVFSPTEDKSECDFQTNRQADSKILVDEDKQEDSAILGAAGSQTENSFEEDLTVFCPPRLYYSNTTQERRRNKEQDFKSSNRNSKAFTFENSCSDGEENKRKDEGPRSKEEHRIVKHTISQEPSGSTPNLLGEALKQLPLFNALVAELSQLSGQIPQQSFTVDPSQAWIYKPASIEPWVGHENTPQQAQTQFLHETRQHTGTHLKHLQPPINFSTPIVNPARRKGTQDETLAGTKRSHRKKLVYGTTKTFHLRLKQNSPLKAKHRECVELLQREIQSRAAKVKTSGKNTKSSGRKCELNQRASFDENIETLNSALRLTVTLKQEGQHGEQGSNAEAFPPHSDSKSIHLPDVDTDGVPLRKDDDYEHHSKPGQSESQSDEEKLKFLASHLPEEQRSRRSSSESSFSESRSGENVDADYADDFDSLGSRDDSFPEPDSESSRAKTPKGPVWPDPSKSDSRSQSIQRRPVVLPVPVKAPSSPVRPLMGTHIIQPRTCSSALSFSSDDDERETVCSRKEMTASDKVEPSSIAESCLSSRGERTESPGNSVRGFSVESVSSFEAEEGDELEDELGSLDFRAKYQHISELVASKLPGYTM